MLVRIEKFASIEEARAKALSSIDKKAGDVRAMFITTDPGQELTYEAKRQEATDYIAQGRPADTTPFIFLSAEAAARGKTVDEVADEVIANSMNWKAIGAQIEALRLSYKDSVRSAGTADEAARVGVAAVQALEYFVASVLP